MRFLFTTVLASLLVAPVMGDELPQAEYQEKRLVCTDGAFEDETLDEGVFSETYIEFRKEAPDFIERGYIEYSNASARLACPAFMFNGLDGNGKSVGFKCAGVWNMDLINNPDAQESGGPRKIAVDTTVEVVVTQAQDKKSWVANFTAAKMDGAKEIKNVPCKFVQPKAKK